MAIEGLSSTKASLDVSVARKEFLKDLVGFDWKPSLVFSNLPECKQNALSMDLNRSRNIYLLMLRSVFSSLLEQTLNEMINTSNEGADLQRNGHPYMHFVYCKI